MNPWITIIVVAYERYLHLPIMIHAFLTQTNPNWKMVILHDGPNPSHHDMVAPFIEKYNNISYHQSKKRFNDYGHSLREWAINEFIDTPWALITNDDNYYVPTFLSECDSIIKHHQSAEFIMFDCLMNTVNNNSIHKKNYQVQYTLPKIAGIDMGSFIVKSDLLKNVGFKSKMLTADGILVENILNQYPNLNIFKINQALFVHN